MHPTLTIARRAAISAGKVILRYYENLERVNISSKRHNDLVSEVDIKAEQEIIQVLRRTYPDHAILGEESGALAGTESYNEWLIDPLDGTTNYLHGVPHFCVSIAFRQHGRLESGLIYDPLRQEFFSASRGGGAHLNDRRMRVAPRNSLDGALIATGLPPWKVGSRPAFIAALAALISQGAMSRSTGSAALDMAHVACGRLDGFWELGLNPWDIGAGTLLVQEAGGLVGDCDGGHEHFRSGNVTCANPKLFKALVKTLHANLNTPPGAGAATTTAP